MTRAAVIVILLALVPRSSPGQEPGVLHVKVTLRNAALAIVPVPRHALLISDNPATSAPRRVVTGTNGTVDVRLRPGNYTVESDEPLAFAGKGYQWTKTIDIKAGQDLVLELTADNAEVGNAPPPADSPEKAASLDLLPEWKDSIVAVWTPASRASGFLVAASGLIATSQRAIGSATDVEVQVSASVKVAARVLASDRVRDVVVLWVDPGTIASLRPLPLNCDAAPPIVAGQKLLELGAPMSGDKELSPGTVLRVAPHATVVDFRLAPGSTGGPVFVAGGGIVGLSSPVDDPDERKRRDSIVVPTADACAVVRVAETAMASAPRPLAAPLPVEPLRPFPAEALDAAARQHQNNMSAYRTASNDFDITFLTSVVVAADQRNAAQTNARASIAPGRAPSPTDFGPWSDYFADVPPVLAVRVTPKLTESFWTTVARGAAATQGMALPPVQHFKAGFARLRAWCGEVEVVPIHPFVLDQPVSDTASVREGLYIFDPQAFGPHCTTVKLALYSEKDPQKADTRTIDARLIDRIWQDFAPLRPY